MEITTTKGKPKGFVLVFAITNHNLLGTLIEPFAVGITPKGQFEYGFKKLTIKTFGDYFDNVSDIEKSLIQLLDKYSDESLQKRFNTKKLKTTEFYESLSSEFVSNFIRPFVDKVIYDAVGIMADNGLKIYPKGAASERIREGYFILQKEFIKPCFHFEKRVNNTLYRLSIAHGEQELSLLNKNAALLSVKPCVLLLEKKVYRFESQWDGKKLVPFFQKEYIEIPAKNEKQFFKKFAEKSIGEYPFIAKGFEVLVIKNNPVPLLQLENHWQGNLALGLYFNYPNGITFLPGNPANAHTRFVDKGDTFYFEKVERNMEFEKQITGYLVSVGLIKIDSTYYSLPQIKSIDIDKQPDFITRQAHLFVDWMNQNVETNLQNGIQLSTQYSERDYYVGKMEINLDLTDKIDWFDIKVMVRFNTFEMPFVSLKSNILAGNREFILPDGSIALIPEEWMSRYQDLLKFAIRRGDRLELKKYHYPLLEYANLIPANFKDNKFGFAINGEYDLPHQLTANLRPYQKSGYNWMMQLNKNGMGGCLADDMGIGKTLQALALLTQVHLNEAINQIDQKGHAFINTVPCGGQLDIFSNTAVGELNIRSRKCSLIIMPLSLIHNWLHEIGRFSPQLRAFVHAGANRTSNTAIFGNFDLILTTYGTIRNDVEFLSSYHFKYIILDESQIIKNASSKIFSAIKRLRSDNRLVLTGTPVENSLVDLWSQFSFLNPGLLGGLKYFREQYVLPIEKRGDTKKVEKLKTVIAPFILRRTKDDVAKELPPLTEKIHYCEMTPEQEQFYEKKKSEVRNAIFQGIERMGADKSRILVLTGLMRLRLIANHPMLFDREYTFGSGKYLEITRNIEKLISENHKVLVFSQFVKHLNLFSDFFKDKDISFSMLTGSTNEKERKRIIAEFQNDDRRKLFLISLKAGGVGLNLTGADYVFMLDPWWNPAVEDQAINRAHRIGQDKKVFVYKFITRNTVEEKILTLQQKKSNLAGLFLRRGAALNSFDIEELTNIML